MKRTLIWLAGVAAAGVLLSVAFGRSDPNEKPIYGKTGLPANCRAYVQTAIDGYRSHQYTADEAMNGLERNCGAYGHTWGTR